MTKKGTIYLSGAMEFAADGKLGADWRLLCSDQLRERGFTPLDITAMDVAYTKQHNSLIDCTVRGVTDPTELLTAKANIRHHFVLADLNLIDKHSDALIIKYDEGVRRGAGTISECQHAFNHQLPIFLVNSYQDSNQIPGWLYALTTKVFNTFEELYQYLDTLPSGILKKDAYGNRRSNNHYLCSLCGAVEAKHGDYFVSTVSPTYCKSCVDIVRRAREHNYDRYEYFTEYMKQPLPPTPFVQRCDFEPPISVTTADVVAAIKRQRLVRESNAADQQVVDTSKQVIDIFNLIAEHGTKMFLGGSRRMKQLHPNSNLFDSITPDTDWDVYATYSADLLASLKCDGYAETPYAASIRQIRMKDQAGVQLMIPEQDMLNHSLKAEGNEYALDIEAITILQKGNVQIVLRKDALFYKKVFDNIDPVIYANMLWKSSPHVTVNRNLIQPFFNMLFKLAHQESN